VVAVTTSKPRVRASDASRPLLAALSSTISASG
jgi:hypothetical protein